MVIDTAPLTLDEIIGHLADADRRGLDVARLHSGDPSLYGAIAEQMRRLEALGIPFDVTPGVPSFAAAAAALGRELTLPEIAQTVILTRTATRSSPMPERESLERLGASGATLAIHLSVNNLARVVRALTPPLRARLSRGRRLPGQLAGRTLDPRHPRRYPRQGEKGAASPAPPWCWSGVPLADGEAPKAGSTPPTITRLRCAPRRELEYERDDF